ncbi:MAG: TIR domain-containing protein [Cyanobacteria bacterium J06627_8]
MVKRFGDYLLQFARSVDLVKDEDFNEIIKRAKEYALTAFRLDYFELYLFKSTRSIRGTETIEEDKLIYWQDGEGSIERMPWDHYLTDSNGELVGQIAYSFTKKIPMWIVDENKQYLHLEDKVTYNDLWSRSPSEVIPPYVKHSHNDSDIRTSIYYPLSVNLQDDSGVSVIGKLGVLALESHEYCEPTEEAKKEIGHIAEAIAILNHLKYTRKFQYSNTKIARSRLVAQLNECFSSLKTYPIIQKPKIFFGFAREGSKDMISLIRIILEEFGEIIDVYDWEKDQRPNNIHQTIFQEIRESRYGIFYLSKIQDSSENQDSSYVDNLNVLIEIGMMYSAQADWSESNLIIIREEDSPNIPFDIEAHRRIDIDRDSSGKLKEEKFRRVLISSLKYLIEDL